MKSADLKTSMAHKSFPCFDMKLGIYPYCDIFNHVNAVVWNHILIILGSRLNVSKNTKLIRGLRRRTYDFEYNYRCVWLILEIILVYVSFVMFSDCKYINFSFQNGLTWPQNVMFYCASAAGLITRKLFTSRHSKIRKICIQTTQFLLNK